MHIWINTKKLFKKAHILVQIDADLYVSQKNKLKYKKLKNEALWVFKELDTENR